MAKKHSIPGLSVFRKLTLHRRARSHAAKPAGAARSMPAALWRRIRLGLQRPWLRRSLIAGGAVFTVVCLVFGGLWWRLGSGPIAFDVATPWLTSAIEDNFGQNYKVQVGGTQIERDGNGRIRLRLRDIVVRDAEGAIAASAPKAEVGISTRSLLTGRMRAERLALVGAEMSVRIEPGGQVTVFAGSDKRPIATASALSLSGPDNEPAREPEPNAAAGDASAPKSGIENLTALLAWIDSLSKSGLDGHDLAELGLESGNLIVDDQRNGKRWNFENIDLGLMRSRGGVLFKIESANKDQPWSLMAAVSPVRSGRRLVSVEARRVLAKDLLLALRLGDEPIMAEVPLSASLQAEIGSDGTTQTLQGRIIAEGGYLTESKAPGAPAIDRAEFNLEWDPMRRVLAVPFQIITGGNRFTLFANVEPPRARGDSWSVALSGGTVVLGMDKSGGPPLVFNSIKIRARIDPATHKLTLEQGDIANADLALLVSGGADFSTGDPWLNFQITTGRMPVAAMKKLWPTFVNAPVRNWTIDHVSQGDVESIAIATNAHLSAFKRGGPPVPDRGLSIDIVAHNATVRPLDTLPPIENAELTVQIIGRNASVSVSKGTVTLSSGRSLAVTNGLFEVPDCEVPQPPTRARMRIQGPVPAAAELLETERLREFVGMPFDVSSAKGDVFAQFSVAFPMKADLPPGSSAYLVTADIANFSVDKMVMGQKVEAQSLRINASDQGYQIRGDTKIAGAAAILDYRKDKTDDAAKVRIQTTLDDIGRGRLGLDAGNAIAGPVPVDLTGYIGPTDRDSRFVIDADLTPARIDNLLPGWSKPFGKPMRAKFALVNKGQTTRVEDLVVEGSGTHVKGNFELDASGNVVTANFPVFNLSGGDRANLKADRSTDGALRVAMRGDVFDGTGFIKSTVAGGRPDLRDKPPVDLDLDLKLGTVIGFNGETLRNLELKLSRRVGQIRIFGMNGRLGRDAQFAGDLRRKLNASSNVLYFESRDAGAFFRFMDSYARMSGGQMWVALDAPTANTVPQEGIIAIRDFAIRGEAALDRFAGVPADGRGGGVKFDRMKAAFTRMPGRLEIRDGVVNGNIGATIDGQIDYLGDEVHLRGSFVPLYPLNNMLGQLPLFGPLLGGANEGLVGVTYEVVGPPNAPRLNVNPLSAVAPGLFRKLFEFRNAPAERGFEQYKP